MKEFFQHPLYGQYGQDTVAELCWCLGILIVGLLFRKLITRWIVLLLFRFLKKYSGPVGSDSLLSLIRRPLSNLLLLVAIYFAFDRLSFPAEWKLVSEDHFGVKMTLIRSYQALFALSFTLVVLRMIDYFGFVMMKKSRLNTSKSDDQLVPFLMESVKVIVIVMSLFVALGSIFKINVASLIAGLGIGGLAVALAAKESIENLLGSFTIFLDKPFVVGDHVKVGGIEGTVESIGFRSTRLRTVEKSFLTVPNKKMVDVELDNLTLRTHRRVRFVLSLDFSTTPAQLRQITQEINARLDSDSRVQATDKQVRLQELGTASINLLILFFLEDTSSDTYFSVLEEINYSIIDIVHRSGTHFSQPTH
jgi:MscS family membrane protein